MWIEHVLNMWLVCLQRKSSNLELLVARLESSDVDSLKDIGATLDCCSSIGVDFNDGMRANGCRSEFSFDLFVNDNHLISRLTVFVKTTQIVAQ